MPLKPGSHTQLKLPAGRLKQRPRGPQTLEEMWRTPAESLLATATVQLSITARTFEGRRKKMNHHFSQTCRFVQYYSIIGHLGTGWFCSRLGAFHTSSPRSLRDRRSRSPAPCCGTWPRSRRGLDHKRLRGTSWRSEAAKRRGADCIYKSGNIYRSDGVTDNLKNHNADITFMEHSSIFALLSVLLCFGFVAQLLRSKFMKMPCLKHISRLKCMPNVRQCCTGPTY